MKTGFSHKLYRCEWVAYIDEVDQYGQSHRPYWEDAHPTREAALASLERVSKPHEYVSGRRVPRKAPHSYMECGVRYREVLERDIPASPFGWFTTALEITV